MRVCTRGGGANTPIQIVMKFCNFNYNQMVILVITHWNLMKIHIHVLSGSSPQTLWVYVLCKGNPGWHFRQKRTSHTNHFCMFKQTIVSPITFSPNSSSMPIIVIIVPACDPHAIRSPGTMTINCQSATSTILNWGQLSYCTLSVTVLTVLKLFLFSCLVHLWQLV